MLDIVKARDLPTRPSERRWLVESLWGEEAVGVLGGEPKCFKSFLSLDLAVAVATGRPCLRRFAVSHPGCVVLFAAEDALWEVRRRLEGMACAAGVPFDSLNIQVITAPVVRLDLARDREQLEETIATVLPRLVVLDPFVRMHRVDENVVSEVAPLLAYLRVLQRKYRTAILLVHHARKGGSHLREGQALRGSSELHAWGDSNLYMRRKSTGLTLTVEHRNAPSIGGLVLEFATRGEAAALEVVERSQEETAAKPPTIPPEARVLRVLEASEDVMTMRQIRMAGQMRGETVSVALGQLVSKGVVLRTDTGYRLSNPSREAIPATP